MEALRSLWRRLAERVCRFFISPYNPSQPILAFDSIEDAYFWIEEKVPDGWVAVNKYGLLVKNCCVFAFEVDYYGDKGNLQQRFSMSVEYLVGRRADYHEFYSREIAEDPKFRFVVSTSDATEANKKTKTWASGRVTWVACEEVVDCRDMRIANMCSFAVEKPFCRIENYYSMKELTDV